MADSGFKCLDHVTDAYLEAWGPTIEEAFNQSAKGMINLMFDIDKIQGSEEVKIEAKGKDLYQLLYDWLERVLVIIFTDNVIMSEFRTMIMAEDGLRLMSTTFVEAIDIDRHNYKTEVKGITYHDMKIIENSRYVTKFMVDL